MVASCRSIPFGLQRGNPAIRYDENSIGREGRPGQSVLEPQIDKRHGTMATFAVLHSPRLLTRLLYLGLLVI